MSKRDAGGAFDALMHAIAGLGAAPTTRTKLPPPTKPGSLARALGQGVLYGRLPHGADAGRRLAPPSPQPTERMRHEGQRSVAELGAILWHAMDGPHAAPELEPWMAPPHTDPIVALTLSRGRIAEYAAPEAVDRSCAFPGPHVWLIESEHAKGDTPAGIAVWRSRGPSGEWRTRCACLWTCGKIGSTTHPLVIGAQWGAEASEALAAACVIGPSWDVASRVANDASRSAVLARRRNAIGPQMMARIAIPAALAWLDRHGGTARPAGRFGAGEQAHRGHRLRTVHPVRAPGRTPPPAWLDAVPERAVEAIVLRTAGEGWRIGGSCPVARWRDGWAGYACPCPTSARWTSQHRCATVRAMEVQNQVGRSLRADLVRLRGVLDSATSQGITSLGQLADRVCEAFHLRDGRGRCQRASCRKALDVLQAQGAIALPVPREHRAGGHKPRVLAHAMAPAHDVPGTVAEVRELALVRVETDAQRLVWNTLLAHEHPRGAGPFVGHQVRYLVGSAHGWLGAVGFAASARRLRARDAWIGWDDAHRCAHLHRVVGLCRFLIRPGVVCRNLASHVLGRVVRALGEDFERLYGYRPWLLETFVDEREHTGASLRAANWVRVGESAGRGRNDRTHGAPETRKAAYLYELEPAWRARLGVSAPGVAPLAPGEGLDAASWAGNEFGTAPLGDARLSARLVESAHHMAQCPMRAITGAANGARAVVKGHYRLIDQPADSAVTVEHILAPHRARTLQRMASESTVLCVHDGTSLSFTRRGQTQGLGVIGSNQTGALARGLHLHTTLAVSTEGLPLGVLRAGFDAPSPPEAEAEGPKAREEKKSFRWVESLRDCAHAAEHLPDTRVVCTMDREADFRDLFIEQREHAVNVELLVRAKVNRVLANDTTPEGDTVVRRLFDEVRSAPARGACTVEVSRQSARVKASKQPRKPKRRARLAETTLRYEPVALPCPGAAPLALWMVHAREEHPPANTEALEWFLLTTVPVTSTEEAKRILKCYALRWRIEDYFRILKSGCKVEELQHHSAERLERAIAIKMVVGWRIQLMVRLGREVPELPAEVLFCDIELRVLATFARSRKFASPRHLGEAVELLARLGGWLGRTRDPPGAQLLWHGYTKLAAMTFAFELRDEYG